MRKFSKLFKNVKEKPQFGIKPESIHYEWKILGESIRSEWKVFDKSIHSEWKFLGFLLLLSDIFLIFAHES